MLDISLLWQEILVVLKEMGASSVQKGKPYGLRGYADYHRDLFPGSFRKNACEEPIMAGIELGLKRRGIYTMTERERYYPNSGRCDLVINPGNSESLWIEFKTAYRQHLAKSNPGSVYHYNYDGDNCYDPGRGRDSWVAGASDIAGKDIPKLLSLGHSEAKYIGVLLLGFDRVTAPLTNMELYALLPPCLDEWQPAHGIKEGVTWDDSYPVRKELGFRERIWFWYRPVALK